MRISRFVSPASPAVFAPFFFVVCALYLLFSATPVHAGTTFIREIARSSAQILIVSSGPQAQDTAQAFKTSILTHPETKKRDADIKMALLASAAGDIAAYGSKSTVIFCLAGRELSTEQITTLRGMVAQGGEFIGTKTSFVYGKMTEKGAGKPAFSIGVYAPDAERLARLRPRLDLRSEENFRDLAVSETWQSNRLAVFGGNDSAAFLRSWGAEQDVPSRVRGAANRLRLGNNAPAAVPAAAPKTLSGFLGLNRRSEKSEKPEVPVVGAGQPMIWDDIRFYPLAEREKLRPEDLEERNEVYFINRAAGETLPPPRADLLGDLEIKPTTVAVRTAQNADGGSATVLSAPNAHHLEIRTRERYKTLANLQSAPPTEELIDLRSVKSTALRILGDLPENENEQVRSLVGTAIRQQLKIQVQDGGAFLKALQSVVSTDQLLGGTGTELRKKYGVQYVWVYHLSEYAGETKYKTDVTRMTPTPLPFGEAQPTEPTRGRKESDSDFNERRNNWSREVDAWKGRQQKYDTEQENATAQYRRDVNETQAASVRGTLQLVDLNNASVAGAVIWECPCSDQNMVTKNYQSEVLTKRNRDNSPEPLPAPDAKDTCAPPVRYEAAKRAVLSGLQILSEKALLPEKLIGAALAATSSPTLEKSADGNVVDIEDKTVIVSLGKDNGIRIGQRIKVVLKSKQITDVDGNVLSVRTVDAITLKVTAVDARTADCVAATPEDAAKIKLLKVGMPLQKQGQAQ